MNLSLAAFLAAVLSQQAAASVTRTDPTLFKRVRALVNPSDRKLPATATDASTLRCFYECLEQAMTAEQCQEYIENLLGGPGLPGHEIPNLQIKINRPRPTKWVAETYWMIGIPTNIFGEVDCDLNGGVITYPWVWTSGGTDYSIPDVPCVGSPADECCSYVLGNITAAGIPLVDDNGNCLSCWAHQEPLEPIIPASGSDVVYLEHSASGGSCSESELSLTEVQTADSDAEAALVIVRNTIDSTIAAGTVTCSDFSALFEDLLLYARAFPRAMSRIPSLLCGICEDPTASYTLTPEMIKRLLWIKKEISGEINSAENCIVIYVDNQDLVMEPPKIGGSREGLDFDRDDPDCQDETPAMSPNMAPSNPDQLNCPPGMIKNTAGECVPFVICIGGTVVDGQCTCPAGEEPLDGACVPLCGQHSSRDGGFCTCDTGFEDVSGVCLPVCGTNEVRDSSGNCVCDSGFELVSGTCVETCPEMKERVDGTCVDKCSTNQVRNGSGTCVCAPAYELVSGACVPECGTTKERVDGTCVDKCSTNQVRNGSGTCVCAPAYELVNGACVPECGTTKERVDGTCVDKCSTNQVRNGSGTCVCSPDYELVNGACVLKCGSNEERVGGVCLTMCRSNEVRNGSTCVCASGFTKINGSCVPACTASQERVDGTCVPKCGTNEVRTGGVCVCISGYEKVAGVCVPVCTGGQSRVNGVCQCPPGQTMGPTSCFSCSAPLLPQASSGQCVCPEGMTKSGTKCVCPSSKAMNQAGNGCVEPSEACPPGTNWFSASGVCQTCNCGFCPQREARKDGWEECCEINGGGNNCKPPGGNSSLKGCNFAKSDTFYPGYSDQSGNVCSGVEVKNGAQVPVGCGCKPSSAAPCTYDPTNPDRCFICTVEDLSDRSSGANSPCSGCRACLKANCAANWSSGTCQSLLTGSRTGTVSEWTACLGETASRRFRDLRSDSRMLKGATGKAADCALSCAAYCKFGVSYP